MYVTMKKILFATIIIFLFSNNNLQAQSPQGPPPTEVVARGDVRDSLVSELRVICDYEAYFDSIRELRLKILAEEYGWSTERVSEIRSKVKFSDFDMHYFYSGYSRYSTEELKEILYYFKEMTEEELSRSNIKHERVIVMNIEGNNGENMDSRIKRASE